MRCMMSARFKAVARTRTNTCSGVGTGSGTSVRRSTSGPPGVAKVIACMCSSRYQRMAYGSLTTFALWLMARSPMARFIAYGSLPAVALWPIVLAISHMP